MNRIPAPPEKPIEPAAFVAWYCRRACIRPEQLHQWVNARNENSVQFALMRDAWLAATECHQQGESE